MNNIKVSVIIPSLDARPYIRQCLDSVRIQTLQELEILCVDAGSVDGTLDVLEEYAALDNRIHLIMSDKKSYGYQVNLGIGMAKGDYIGIIEPDDYIAEEMFEKLYHAACANRLDFVKSNFYQFMDCLGRRYYQKWERTAWLGENKRCLPFPYNQVILLKETPQALVYGDHGNIWSGIYRRKFLLDNHIKLHETPGASYQDTGFAILCSLEAERIMFLESCFYRYRQQGTVSSVSSQEKHSHIISEYAWIWEQMNARGFVDGISRSFYMSMKFHSYLWNYNRLCPDSRYRFLENLKKDELLEFDEALVGYTIPEKEMMQNLWQGSWQDVAVRNEKDMAGKKRAAQFLSVFERASQIVVVCAGQVGISVLRAEDRLNTGKICAVCDNDVRMQGQYVEGREIMSVEAAVRAYPGAYFVIASRCHAQEICRQLTQFGVAIEQIVTWEETIRIGNKVIKFLSEAVEK